MPRWIGYLLAAIGLAMAPAAAADQAGPPLLVAKDPMVRLRDNFNAAGEAADPDFGLNRDLRRRQRGPAAPVGYARASGVWFDAPPAEPALVRVGDPTAGGGRLSFHGFAAVRLDAPVAPDLHGRYRIAARVDPVAGERASLGWVSLSLAERAGGGWVTGAEMLPGVLVRSNGAIQVFAHGVEKAVTWAGKPPAPADTYDVVLEVRAAGAAAGRVLRLDGRINGARFSAVLAEGDAALLPAASHLFIGAHFHPGDELVSWIDDLAIGS